MSVSSCVCCYFLLWPLHINLGGGFHLELVHRGLGFGDIDLIVVLSRHDIFSFLIDDFLSFVVRFGYRKGSLTRIRADMRALRW